MDSENLSHHPYSLLSALKEGFFTDITVTASNGEKVINVTFSKLFEYWIANALKNLLTLYWCWLFIFYLQCS